MTICHSLVFQSIRDERIKETLMVIISTNIKAVQCCQQKLFFAFLNFHFTNPKDEKEHLLNCFPPHFFLFHSLFLSFSLSFSLFLSLSDLYLPLHSHFFTFFFILTHTHTHTHICHMHISRSPRS
jgi:hypothetical protein